MRTEFKKIAEDNTVAAYQLLGDFYQGSWKLVQTSSNVVDRCRSLDTVANDLKKHNLLIMLRNSISDICCCLDSLERGHDRTILNNLRMIFEDFCCVLHIHSDNAVYEKFLANKHSATDSIGPAGKLRPNDTKFKWIYGELSKVSHHKAVELIARQMVTREGPLSHLKPINPDRLHIQVYPLMIILDFLRSIGEVAEEMCLHLLAAPYFWTSSSERNLTTKEDDLIRRLFEKAKPIFEMARLDTSTKPC